MPLNAENLPPSYQITRRTLHTSRVRPTLALTLGARVPMRRLWPADSCPDAVAPLAHSQVQPAAAVHALLEAAVLLTHVASLGLGLHSSNYKLHYTGLAYSDLLIAPRYPVETRFVAPRYPVETRFGVAGGRTFGYENN